MVTGGSDITPHKGLKNGKCRCEYCDFSSSSKFNLTNHLKKNHSNPESRVPKKRGKGLEGSRKKNMTVKMPRSCDQCEWSGNSPAGLWYHKKSKHQKVFLDCHYCDYKCSRSSVLEEHMIKNHSQKMIRASEVKVLAEEPWVKNEIMVEKTKEEQSKNEAMDVLKDEDAVIWRELPPHWREEGGVLIFSPPWGGGEAVPQQKGGSDVAGGQWRN